MRCIESVLGDLARRQHGLITAAQARALGARPGQIRSRVDSGRWSRIGPAVYCLAGVPGSWQQLALAACLGGPVGALASFLTAGALAGLCPPPPVPHITVGWGRSARSPIAIVHRSRHLSSGTTMQGVPCTDVARTLVDSATILGPVRLQRMVDEAMHRHVVTVRSVELELATARPVGGWPGEARLLAAIDPWRSGIAPGSPAEHRLRSQLVQWGYPEPDLQVPVVAGDGTVLGRIDCGWPDVRIGIEYDSVRHHGEDAWASDLARQRAIEAEGWTVLRADKVDLRPGERRLRSDLDRAWTVARRAA